MLRDTVQPALDGSVNGIDRSIRLVFTGKGLGCRNAATVGANVAASRRASRVTSYQRAPLGSARLGTDGDFRPLSFETRCKNKPVVGL
jgi:hypothetical protein